MSSAERPKPNAKGKYMDQPNPTYFGHEQLFVNNTIIKPLYTKAHRLSAKLNALINSLNREDSGLRRSAEVLCRP